VSYESFRQTIQRTILPRFEIKVRILAISVRIKGIGLQNVQTVKKPVPKKTKVEIPVIIVKREDIGLQSALRNNRSRKRKKKRKRKNPETFRKRRKEREKKRRKRRRRRKL
jgi:hypothetical protein